MSILDNITEGLGQIARPLKPVADFVLPQAGEATGINGLGGAINALAGGIGDAIAEGPVGLLNIGREAIQGEGTARDRLLMGGMALVGGTFAARSAHAAWKAEHVLDNEIRRAPVSGRRGLIDMGDRERFSPSSEAAWKLARERPGANPRTLQILAPEDNLEVARGFGRWDPMDEEKTAAGAALFEKYAARIPETGPGAQIDFARFNTAMTKDLFKYEGNKEIRDLWKRATEDPGSFMDPSAAADVEKLFSTIQAFGDATNGLVDDDLTVGIVGRVTRVDVADNGVQLYVSHPVGWNDGMAIDPLERAARLAQLNYRALADRGRENLRTLFNVGIADMRRVENGGSSIFDEPLELGPNWYPQALEDVQKTFGISVDTDPDAVSRAVAAVSFLSEAEDWSTNIIKAKTALELSGDVTDPDFQSWLRNGIRPNAGAGSTRGNEPHVYAGTAAKEHEAHFNEIWERIKTSGFGKVDGTTMRKILRLWGGVESVDEVFRSTAARKQKNFYRNIRFPNEDYPVTIDRHAFDAFLGMDAGIQDRPIDVSVLDSDQVYDVVADVYRDLADELGVRPHAVQAVIWEAWRAAKKKAGRDGWSRNDPFMLEPRGTPNPAFEALHGRGGAMPSVLESEDILDVRVLDAAASIDDLTSVATPTGGVIIAANVTDAVATAQPHLYPAVVGADRVPRWSPIRPTAFQDYQRFVSDVGGEGAFLVTSLDAELPLGHPGMRQGRYVMGFVDDGVRLRPPKGAKIEELGRAAIERPELSLQRLGPDDLTPEVFAGPNSPMKTHAWAAISAELNEEQVLAQGRKRYSSEGAADNLHAELVKRGYKPIRQIGKYDGAEETSFLVFGITPGEAAELGEKFGQDSVLTNNGFAYNRLDPKDPTMAGAFEPIGGVSFKGKDMAYGWSEVVVGGETVRWTATDFADAIPDAVDEIAARPIAQVKSSMRQVALAIPEGRDAAEFAADMEARGLRDLTVYSPDAALPGFQRAHETYASDGRQTVAVRSQLGNTAAPHGRHIFVRHADELPDAMGRSEGDIVELGNGQYSVGNVLKIDGRFPDGEATIAGPFHAKLGRKSTRTFGIVGSTLTPIFNEAEAASGRFEAILRVKEGKKLSGVIEATDPNDLTPATRAKVAIDDSGWEVKLELKADGKTFSFPNEYATQDPGQIVVAKGGIPMTRSLKRDRPRVHRGIEFDPAFRVGNEVHEIAPILQQGITDTIDRVMAAHEDAVQRWRLPRVVVMDESADAYAWLQWQSGGSIVLPKEWWSNPGELESALQAERAFGNLSPHIDRDKNAQAIIAHEFGHVLHGALRLEERMVKSSQIDKEIIDLVKSHGSGNWKTIARRELSVVAASEPSEVVAEAYSEILYASRPSRLAQNVYDLVSDRLESKLAFRKAINF